MESKVVTDNAIMRAVDHANMVHHNWSETAYTFLVEYIKVNTSFMAEDVRYASAGKVPSPPSQRAWGAIMRRAAKEGLIKHVRYQNVKNIKAHRATASVWHTQNN